MSAFQPYVGAYAFGDQTYSWRCYATARIHAVRRAEHAPFPTPPGGRKWVWLSTAQHEPEVAWLVDEGVDEFSQILLQIQAPADASLRRARRPADADAVVSA
jgi:hypothetical protein